ncbi:DNA adenine methylase [Mucilaginibacter jinjuensis]|uniref:Site-specific DNA-methyltransferase (adenine-specific) n=1 Tax=Mucilaginibacter jinjuensis TaxID=1176721 RepID=A0ABY7TEF7_9SPHI|nr:Dam family site-specific DNA-(adenine-N6)-methyltransferase [Mucilaginibacter jinjuensis]WCT14421.1 Dam family site-specific DNA-(adenine-N6)-methyltransferase [Mucilaginibacter jinjuensis]
MKPLIKYRGGKSKELPHLVKHIPDFSGRYIEPFFGGGALYFYLEPQNAIINDINSKLMSFYSMVKSDYNTLSAELQSIERIYSNNRKRFEQLKANSPDSRVNDENEAFYYELRNMYNELIDKKYSDGALYFYINKTAYSGMIRHNAKGEFNVPYGRYANLNTSLITEAHQKLLGTTEIFNSDYKEIFQLAKKDDFMFLDPPYNCIFSDYGNIEHKDGFTEKNHIELASAYRRLKCKALMVIGRTPLTEKLYGDLIIDEYDKSYAVNIRNRFKASASHILLANYKSSGEMRYLNPKPQIELAS